MAGSRRTKRTTRRAVVGTGPLQLRVMVDDSVEIYPLPESGEWTIGRAEGCDVRIEDPSVSRHHAVLVFGPAGLQIRDAGSTYGLRVRGERLEQGRDVNVDPGDAIEAGGALMVIEPQPLVSARTTPGSSRPRTRPRPQKR